MSDTDNPPDGWTDNRPQQGTLGTEDPTQHRENKLDEGTDEFEDDRTDVYDPAKDIGSQASLTPEKIGGGQQSLGGGDAEVGPEWGDEEDTDDREGADDRDREVPETLANPFELTDTEHSGRTTTWTWTAPATNEKMETFNVAIISKPSAYTVKQGPGDREFRDWASDGEYQTFDEALTATQDATERAISKNPPLVETSNRNSDDETDDCDDVEANSGTDDERVLDGERIEFGSIDAANEFRDEHPDALHPDDTRVSKTVHFHPNAADDVLDKAGQESMISQDQAKKYGQAKLTDSERDKLEDIDGWTWGTHGFHAMSAKAILQEEGATPWLDYYDHEIEANEHISVAQQDQEMVREEGLSGKGETGMRNDSTKSEAEIAQELDKGTGEMCRSARYACEEGEPKACDALLDDCGYSEDEIEEILAAVEVLGEDPTEVYDPAADTDSGQPFEEWARENSPDEADPEIPEKPDPLTEPSDEELARLDPTRADDSPAEESDLTPAAKRALSKAWARYKNARQTMYAMRYKAEDQARVINGIRSVNGQDPLTFDELDGWDGGQAMPDDPDETFPAPEGTEVTLAEAAEHGHASGIVQQTFDQISNMAGDVMDPTEGL